MQTRRIPLVDLQLQNRRVREDVLTAIASVVDRGAFVLSDDVIAFEKAFAGYCGVDHCIGVGNGTDAIEIALRALGVTDGDEVILPANTFVATAEAVVRSGARPVLVDCDDDFLIDVSSVRRAITPKTRAVIPVHLYGQMAPVERIQEIVGSDVAIVEDGAQSQGARRLGRRSGAIGDVSCTSFYPGKNLGAFGDAGAITTSSAKIAERARSIRNHGGVRRYEHGQLGLNSRLDAIQAAVLSIKLEVLDHWNAERQRAAEYYHELFGSVDEIRTPSVVPGNQHVWHLYVVRVKNRDQILSSLSAQGIGVGIHYPTPIHRLPAFEYLDLGTTSFPVAERQAQEIMSLPIYPGISHEQQRHVVEALCEEVRRGV